MNPEGRRVKGTYPRSRMGCGLRSKASRSYSRGHPNGVSVHTQAAAFPDPPITLGSLNSDSSSGAAATPSPGDAECAKPLLSPASLPTCLAHSLKEQVKENLISKMFVSISSLKNAYIQLQSAHAPYDPQKLQVADQAVVAEFEKLSELKHSYRETMAALGSLHIEAAQTAACSKEQLVNNLFETISLKKNVVAQSLGSVLAETTLKKDKPTVQVKRLKQRLSRNFSVNCPLPVLPTLHLLECTVLRAYEAAKNFTKLLICLMKAAQWDLDAAANSIEADISYIRRTHKKFVFVSYVCSRMLSGFQNGECFITSAFSPDMDSRKARQACFNEFQELRNADPVEIVHGKPGSMFARYCLKKFLDLVHPKMEESFFGNSDHRKLVADGVHPSSQFYRSFLKLAKPMWLLHRLAFSFDPNACIFQVKRSTEFSPVFMESIVKAMEFDSSPKAQVGFTVIPGFRVEKSIIKCQVYVMPNRFK